MSVDQGWAKSGPRAKSGPLKPFVRPAEWFIQINFLEFKVKM